MALKEMEYTKPLESKLHRMKTQEGYQDADGNPDILALAGATGLHQKTVRWMLENPPLSPVQMFAQEQSLARGNGVASIEDQVRAELMAEARLKLRAEAKAAAIAELSPVVEEEVREALKAEIAEALRPSIEAEIRGKIYSEIEAEVRESLKAEIEESIRAEVEKEREAMKAPKQEGAIAARRRKG